MKFYTKMLPWTLIMLCVSFTLAHQVTGFTKDPECGSTKGCYSDCSASGCSMELSWKPDGSDHLMITLIGKLQNTQKYVAAGFSSDQKMKDDSVIGCFVDGSNVKVRHSYNVANNKFNQAITNANLGLSNAVNSLTGDIINCTVRREKKVSDQQIFDLNKNWFILLAKGPLFSGGIGKHSEPPVVSPSAVDLNAVEDLSGAAKNIMIKIHGSLMVAAWVFCASIGIVLARFYKPTWGSKKLCGEKVWFTFHRMFMVLAFLCCAAGFVVIFVDVKAWSEMPSEKEYLRAHPPIGVAVMALALFNPIGALMRCHPEDKNRFIFNWGHWFMGTSCHCLATLNIIFGVRLQMADLPDYLFYVTVAYAIYQVLFEVCLEIYDCMNRSGGRSSTYEMQDPKTGFRVPDDDAKDQSTKKIILGTHVLIITGFTAAIICMIVLL